MKLFKKMKKGFTLVELVVVIAVIAILSAVSVGMYFGLTEAANRSADEQAVTQMNKVLVLEDTLGNVDSILDVHDVFERNGLTAKNYTALRKGYKFYYDVEDNKVLYVNSNNVVEYPQEEVNKDHSTHNWYSLNLSIEKEQVSKAADGSYTVANGEQLAYIFDQIEKEPNSATKIVLSNDIDMKGASIAVEELPAGSSFTLESSDPSAPRTIKNLVSNESQAKGLSGFGVQTNYYASALFGTVNGDLTIRNVKFENAHVKAEETSTVSIIAGQVYANYTVENVEFVNCSLIGGRNVGLIVGNNYRLQNKTTRISNVKVTNSSVGVSHGRSGLLIGMMEYSYQTFTFHMSGITINNSSMKKVGTHSSTAERPSGFTQYYAYPSAIVNEQQYVSFVTGGTTSTYAFLEKALVTYRYGDSALAAIIDVTNPINDLARA